MSPDVFAECMRSWIGQGHAKVIEVVTKRDEAQRLEGARRALLSLARDLDTLAEGENAAEFVHYTTAAEIARGRASSPLLRAIVNEGEPK